MDTSQDWYFDVEEQARDYLKFVRDWGYEANLFILGVASFCIRIY